MSVLQKCVTCIVVVLKYVHQFFVTLPFKRWSLISLPWMWAGLSDSLPGEKAERMVCPLEPGSEESCEFLSPCAHSVWGRPAAESREKVHMVGVWSSQRRMSSCLGGKFSSLEMITDSTNIPTATSQEILSWNHPAKVILNSWPRGTERH